MLCTSFSLIVLSVQKSLTCIDAPLHTVLDKQEGMYCNVCIQQEETDDGT